MAKLMWTFDIIPVEHNGADGRWQTPRDHVDDVQNAYNDGFVFAPRPFRAKFTPRSAKHKEITEHDFGLAKEILSKYD